ncbi:MAG: MliC family protein [Paracoccaceae bacterium]
MQQKLLRVVAVGVVAFAANFAGAAEPAFDCSRAGSDAEDAICASEQLAELDQELARVYALAVNTPDIAQERLKELRAFQRGWIKGRDECWKASIGLENCITQSYALRIAEIRTQFANSRTGSGTSKGPYPYACEGLNYPLSVVFLDLTDSMVSVSWKDGPSVLPVARSGSGVRYSDETETFWIKGKSALFTPNDGQTYNCLQDDIG